MINIKPNSKTWYYFSCELPWYFTWDAVASVLGPLNTVFVETVLNCKKNIKKNLTKAYLIHTEMRLCNTVLRLSIDVFGT